MKTQAMNSVGGQWTNKSLLIRLFVMDVNAYTCICIFVYALTCAPCYDTFVRWSPYSRLSP